MSYASGSIILEYDFNIFADKINSIYGDTNQGSIAEGVADVGYGISNTTPNVSQGNVITSSEWTSLLDTIFKVTEIQGLTPSAVLPTSVLTGEIITAYEGAQGLLATLDQLFVNRHNIDPSHLVTTSSGSKLQTSRDFAWTGSIEHEFSVSFANWNEVRYFFNTAGEVIISGSKSGGTEAANVTWENIFTTMGDIKFKRNTTSSDFTTANIGFYDLTSTYQNIQSVSDGNSTYTLAAKLDGSPGTAAGLIFKATFDAGSLIDGVITHSVDQTVANSAEISVTEPTYTDLFDFNDVNTNIDPIITINMSSLLNERTYNYVGDVTIQNIFAVTTESVLVNAVEYFFTTDPIDTTLESVIIKDVVQQGDLKITRDPNDIAAPRVVTFDGGDIDDLLSSDTFEFTYRVIDTDTDTHEESKILTINSKYPTWSSHKSTGLRYAEDVQDPSLLEVQILQSSSPVTNEKYGQSISSTKSLEEKVFVGADGYVDVYEKDSATFNNSYDRILIDTITPSNPSGVNSFGAKVSANYVDNAGTDIFYYTFISDPDNTEAPYTNQGAVYPFSWNDVGQVWQEEPKLIPIDIDDMDSFGFSLSASSVTARDGLQEAVSTNYSVAIGAPNKTSGPFVDLGAVYVFSKIVTDYTAAGLNSWSQQKIEPTNKVSNLHFGYDVACDEQRTYMIAGSNATGSAGKAYIFKNTTNWQEEAELVPNDSASDDKFGKFVAISNTGEFVAVGNEAGAIYIFKNNSGSWDQQAKIIPQDGNALNAAKFANEFDNNTTPYIVCTSIEDNQGDAQSGAAYIFDRNITTGDWTEREKFKPSYASTNLQMGSALEFAYINYGFVHTATLYAGALGFDTPAVSDTGGVFTYEFRSNDSPVAPDSEGNQTGKTLGISGDGTRMVIGSPNRDKNGVVYVYDRNISTWDLNVELNYPISGISYSKYGEAVAISDSGNTFVVCGPEVYNSNNESAGAAYVYEYNTGIWNRTLLPMPAVAPSTGDRYGDYCAVSRDGSVIVIGCPKYNTSGTDDAGAAFVYEKSAGEWILKSTLYGFTGSRQTTITPRIFAYEEFGCDASISGINNEFICIGNKKYEGGNYNSGAVCIYSTINALNYDPMQFIEIPAADNEVGTEYGSKVKLARDSNDLVVLSPNSSPAKDSAVYVYRINSNGFYPSTPTQKIGGAPNGSGGLLYSDVSASHDGRDIFITDTGRFSSNRSATTYVYHRSGLGTTWNISATLVPTDFHGLDENQVTNAPVVDFANDSQYVLVGSPQETQEGANRPQGGFYGYFASINDVSFSMSETNSIENIIAGTVAVDVRSTITDEKVYFIDSDGTRTEYNYAGNTLLASTPLGQFTFNKSAYPVSVSWDATSVTPLNDQTARIEYVVTNDLGEVAYDFLDITLLLKSTSWINETLSFPESIGFVVDSYNSTISSDGSTLAVDFDTPVDGEAGFTVVIQRYNNTTKEWELETNTDIGSNTYNNGSNTIHNFAMSLSQDGTYYATSVLNEDTSSITDYGGVYVMSYNSNISQHQLDSYLTIPSVAPNINGTDYGFALDMAEDGSKLIVSAPNFIPFPSNNKTGSLFVYERSGNSWNQVQQINPPNADDVDGLRFGADVKFASGTNLVFVGCEDNHFYVYEFNSGLGYILKTKVTLNDLDVYSKRIDCDFTGDFVAIGDSSAATDGVSSYPKPVNTSVKTTSDGLGNNQIRGLYKDGSTLYAASGSAVSKSTDGGDTWSYVSLGAVANAIFVSGNTVYVSTNGGTYVSTDGGLTYPGAVVIPGGAGNLHRDIVGNPVSGLIAIAIEGSPDGVAISTDNGANWTLKTSADGLAATGFDDMWIDSNDNLYIGQGSSVSISTDNGNTWINKPTPISAGDGNVAVDSTGRIYAGFGGAGGEGVAISTDGGDNWLVKGTADNVGSFVQDLYVDENDYVYAITTSSISFSTDNGSTWSSINTTGGPGGWAIVVENNSIYLGGGGGFQRFDNAISNAYRNVGLAYVYRRNGNVWEWSETKTPVDFTQDEYFGEDVAVSGNSKILVIGSPNAEQVNQDQGAYYLYKLNQSNIYSPVRIKEDEPQFSAAIYDYDGDPDNWGFGKHLSITADGSTFVMQRWGDTGIFGTGGYPYVLTDLPVKLNMSIKEMYNNTIAGANPYAHIKINERDSYVARDAYYNIKGTYENIYASVTTDNKVYNVAPAGLNDTCISFEESSDQHIRLGSVDGSELQSQFTVMGWWLKEPTGTESFTRFFEFGDHGTLPQNGIFLAQSGSDNTSIYLNVLDGGIPTIPITLTNVVTTHAWQFIVLTFNAGTYRLYINNSEVAVAAGPSVPNINFDYAWIGGGSGSSTTFNGRMSNFAIVKDALSVATIDQLYTLGLGQLDGKTYLSNINVSLPDSSIQEEKLIVSSVANPTPQEFLFSGNTLVANIDAGTITIDKSVNPRAVTFDAASPYGGEHTITYSVEDNNGEIYADTDNLLLPQTAITTMQHYIPSGGIGTTALGYSVAIADDLSRVFAGAPQAGGSDYGSVYDFDLDVNSITPLNLVISNRYFTLDTKGAGSSISIDSDASRIIVGAPTSGKSEFRVYSYPNTLINSFTDDSIITGNDVTETSGWASDMTSDGTRLVYGTPTDDDADTDAGVITIKAWDGNDFGIQEAQFTSQAPESGDRLGHAVTISDAGDVVAAAAANENAVYIYRRAGSSWSLESRIDITADEASVLAIEDVEISGNGQVLAVIDKASTSTDKSVIFYKYETGSWVYKSTTQLTGAKGDTFTPYRNSISLSADGQRFIFGARNYEVTVGLFQTYEGAIIVGDDIAGDASSWRLTPHTFHDWSADPSKANPGWSVDMTSDGRWAVVGDPGDDNGTGVVGAILLIRID